ncbi:hypothetical protein BZA77DRAFT_353850 [Pyronema omphalodes]|nr:hypothetical protein BZA77DRAFT_353850 [Pyronema omphalodes]
MPLSVVNAHLYAVAWNSHSQIKLEEVLQKTTRDFTKLMEITTLISYSTIKAISKRLYHGAWEDLPPNMMGYCSDDADKEADGGKVSKESP